MSLFLKSKYKSFHYLNATQFLGALNDNIFKLIVIFLLIYVQGTAASPKILSLAGAIFVIPFLLFSSVAGFLADRYSKRTLIVLTKLGELVIMLLSIIAVYKQSAFFVYSLLFCMAAQSTFFGPSKYGLIPELVPPKLVSKANGSITSMTYMAIILGTFLASYITKITHQNFVLSTFFCVVIGLFGFLTSLRIKKIPTKPSRNNTLSPFFLYDIYKTLKLTSKRAHLLASLLGGAFFLFIGSFTQLNAIPFAIESLGLSPEGGGFIFLSTAIGIAVGSVLAGKLSKGDIIPGLSCISSFAISILFLLLWLFPTNIYMVILMLVLLGIFGGIFLIPLESFIQMRSPQQRRGQIIAAGNFLSFFGVLLSALFLFIISDLLEFSAASGFGFMSLLSLVVSIFLVFRLSTLFFHYIAKMILSPIYHLKAEKAPDTDLIVCKKGSWRRAIILHLFYPELFIITLGSRGKSFPFINRLFRSIFLVPRRKTIRDSLKNALKKADKIRTKQGTVCLFLTKTDFDQAQRLLPSMMETPPYFVHAKKVMIEKIKKGKRISQKQLIISFEQRIPSQRKKTTK